MSNSRNLLKRLQEKSLDPVTREKIGYFDVDSNLLLDCFLEFVSDKKLQLYGAQEEAILELFGNKNVILNTPTGSGKSLVALALHFYSYALGKRSVYTSPIKALVNEKFFSLCRDFGPNLVGMITGDATVNSTAPIICCTAEILATDGLRDGAQAKIDDIIMDEFHYYSDRERGVAWQIPLLTMPQCRFLLMSATMGDSEKFAKNLTHLNKKETLIIRSDDRPVPLEYSYSENPLHETVTDLVKNGRAPIYLVSFTQRECAEEAQNFMSLDLSSQTEKKAIAEALRGFRFSSPYGKELQKFLKHGMGLHHGGLLPKYRILVERLAQQGLLKIIFGTDTLGVGVNVPLRTVLFTKLCKYDGTKTTLLSVRDFRQISGRAGRKGFDDLGTVVVQAPEHVIENLRNERKAAGDAKKLKKLVKKKPPEKGFVPWNQEVFMKLVKGQAEPLLSRFKVTHATLLHVLSRPNEDGCRALRQLIRDSHETPEAKKRIFNNSFALFRSLVERNIIELNPMRVNVDLQEDFSLNHDLSVYLIDTLRLLDKSLPGYSLDCLTLVEAILESPDLILRKQLDRVKSQKLFELKMQGVDFDERVEALEKLEYPKPNREFIYDSYNEFARQHPWLVEENIRPKSIAREMYEGFFSFTDYIREYELQRAEGLLLRYISDVYKGLVQNIPEGAKGEALFEIEVYFGTMIRQIDSSLLDEWEKMSHPERLGDGPEASNADESDAPQKWNRKAFTVAVRNECFRFVKMFANREFASIVEAYVEGFDSVGVSDLEIEKKNSEVNNSQIFSADLLSRLHEEFLQSGHSKINTDFKARSTEFNQIEFADNGKLWLVRQTLTDPEDANDWLAEFRVDVVKSQELKVPVIQLIQFGPG